MVKNDLNLTPHLRKTLPSKHIPGFYLVPLFQSGAVTIQTSEAYQLLASLLEEGTEEGKEDSQ